MTRKKKKQIVNLIRLKSSMEMIIMVMMSFGAEKSALAAQLKVAFGMDYDQALYAMQHDIWRQTMRGLPESAAKANDFLNFLQQCLDYIREKRDTLPDVITDLELADQIHTAEKMTESNLRHDKV